MSLPTLEVILKSRKLPRLDGFRMIAVMAVVLTYFGVTTLFFSCPQIGDTHYAYGPGFTIDALLLAVLLMQLVRLSKGPFWGWLNYRFAVYLGVISYLIYLWHIWGVQAGQKLNFLLEPIQLVAGVVISCLLAAGSYHLLEKRFLALKGRYESRGNSEPEAGLPGPTGAQR